MDTPQILPSIVFAYLPSPKAVQGDTARTAGGCSIVVSPAALGAIRSLADQQDGRLPQWTRPVLERIDDDERHSTDLAVLVRALNRHDVYVRCPLSIGMSNR